MKFLYRGVIIALAAVLTTAAVSRAAVLTLDEAIDLALKNRAAIIAARGNEEIARAGRRSALGAFLPRVDARYSWLKTQDRNRSFDIDSAGVRFEGDLPDADNTDKSLVIGGDITFTLPDAVFNYLAAKEDVAVAKLDVIASEQDMILAVKLRYYAYLAAVQNVTVQEEAVKRAEEQLKLIQSRFELGSAARSDVLKQRVQYGNDQLNLLEARNTITTAEASLAYTIGVDPAQDHSFSTDYVLREYTGTLEEAISYGLEHRPRVLANERNIDAARWRLINARTDYLPKVSPTVGYNYSKTWADDEVEESTFSGSSLSYGFLASWNIFDGFLREERVTLNRVALNNARAALSDERYLTASEIKSAYLQAQLVNEQKRVAQENVEAAAEDLKITQEKYNLGAATILDLLVAQVSLRQAQVSLIQADFDYNLAVANLENAMGKM